MFSKRIVDSVSALRPTGAQTKALSLPILSLILSFPSIIIIIIIIIIIQPYFVVVLVPEEGGFASSISKNSLNIPTDSFAPPLVLTRPRTHLLIKFVYSRL